ncbi:CoA ester lyase [Dactylosporangium sp. NPDC051485]|uniref:HpcH/HpaI aldolase/citrate lyase family protein n=1 Tax=Dactylosporangium sp. NPDC051485 TaxID=3154846 RepID=UPI00344AFC36
MRANTAGRPARTWLFVPGDRPDRFAKALASGADEVILDLEDAVQDRAKSAARDAIARWLTTNQAWVRVNAAGTDHHDDDIDGLARLPGLRGLVIPKAEDCDDLGRIAARCPDVPLVPLVETAIGIHLAHRVAAAPAVARLAFGSLDFAADIRARHEPDALLLARTSLVLASRVAGLPGPLDGVTPSIADPDGLRTDSRRARSLGFAGKLCIHPAQVPAIHEEFGPTVAEVAWAQRVVAAAEASDAGAVALDGAMVDRPVIEQARRILAESDRHP